MLVHSLTPSAAKQTLILNEEGAGVPIVSQRLTNPSRSYEVVGLIPGLAQWVEDLALP